MLIGFSGPSGSGKTTLVNSLKKELEEVEVRVGVIEEVARKVFRNYSKKYGFKNLNEIRKSDVLVDFQMDVFKMQTKLEDKYLKMYDVVLSDRTIYDNLFFSIPAIYSNKKALLDEYIMKFLERDKQRKYSIIFFCQRLNRDVDDGFRTPDITYRMFQEEIIKRLIPHDLFSRNQVVFLPDMPLEDRLKICREHIMFYLLRR